MEQRENKWEVSDRLWAVDSAGYTVVAIPETGKPVRIVCKCQTTVIANQIVKEHNARLESLGVDDNPYDHIKWRMDFNSTDIGELGKYIRLEHANNFVEEARRKFGIQDVEATPECKVDVTYIDRSSTRSGYPVERTSLDKLGEVTQRIYHDGDCITKVEMADG